MAGFKQKARERYRIEAERVANNLSRLDPKEGALRYDKIQRADWVASFALESEAQRNEILACMVDYFFTGIDPLEKLNNQQGILWRAVEPRVRSARKNSKTKAEENFLETGEVPVDISEEFTEKVREKFQTFEEKVPQEIPTKNKEVAGETLPQSQDISKDLLAINNKQLPIKQETKKQEPTNTSCDFGKWNHVASEVPKLKRVKQNGTTLLVQGHWVVVPINRGADAPTVSQVFEYVAEKGLEIDPEDFFYNHAINGWLGVRNWQQCIENEALSQLSQG